MSKSKIIKDYKKIYNETGGWTDKWMDFVKNMHVSKRQYVIEQILNKNYNEIYDVGCGSGDLLYKIRSAGFNGELYGVDIHISNDLKKYAKDYKIKLIQEDFHRLSCESNAVIFFSSIHYSTLDDLNNIIQNIKSSDYHIVEAFIDHVENGELEKNLSKKSSGKYHLFDRDAFIKVFKNKGYEITHEYKFPKDADPMGRLFTYIHFKKNKKSF